MEFFGWWLEAQRGRGDLCLYFAYGSNMNEARMIARVGPEGVSPNASAKESPPLRKCLARLANYELKYWQDKSPRVRVPPRSAQFYVFTHLLPR